KTNTPLRGEAYYKIFINELVASNFRSYQDGNFNPDWIELYNPNDINISLRDYYLSDDKNNLTKYKFPVGGSSAISSKAFMLRFADDSRTTNTYLQFNLAKGGESVFLIGKDGKTIIDS